MASSTRKGTATRERLLETTARLLKKHGYHRMGLQEIVDASGAPRGSIYFHFPGGKEQVVSEAVEYACRHTLSEMRELISTAEDSAQAVEKAFEYAYGLMAKSGRDDICPIGLVSLECNGESEVIREACRSALASVADLFREPLLKDGVLPELVDDVTMLIAGAIEGGFVLSRTQADEKQMMRAGRLLATMVRSYTRSGRQSPAPRRPRTSTSR